MSLFSCKSPETLPIGFVATLTGTHSEIGLEERNGAILAVEKINSLGGVQGQQVVLHVEDDQYEASHAQEAVQNLIDLDVKGVIGHMYSAMTLASYDMLQEAQIVSVSPSSSTAKLNGIDDYFFRIPGSDEDGYDVLVDYAAQTLQLQRVVVIYDAKNKGFSEAMAQQVNKAFSGLGMEIIDPIPYQSGALETLPSVIDRALVWAPEGIVIIASDVDAAYMSQQIRKQNQDVVLMAGDWSRSMDLIAHGGKAVENLILFAKHSDESSSPVYQEFQNSYVQRFGSQPGFTAVLGYEATMLLLEGLKSSLENGISLRDAMAQIRRFEGLQNTLELNAYGDAHRPAHLIQVKNGGFERLE